MARGYRGKVRMKRGDEAAKKRDSKVMRHWDLDCNSSVEDGWIERGVFRN